MASWHGFITHKHSSMDGFGSDFISKLARGTWFIMIHDHHPQTLHVWSRPPSCSCHSTKAIDGEGTPPSVPWFLSSDKAQLSPAIPPGCNWASEWSMVSRPTAEICHKQTGNKQLETDSTDSKLIQLVSCLRIHLRYTVYGIITVHLPRTNALTLISDL